METHNEVFIGVCIILVFAIGICYGFYKSGLSNAKTITEPTYFIIEESTDRKTINIPSDYYIQFDENGNAMLVKEN